MINFIFLTYQKKNIKEIKQNKGTAERSIPSRNEYIVWWNALFGNKHVIEETEYSTC